MAFGLVALDKIPGVCPIETREIFRRALDKLVIRENGEQAKTTFGNLHVCAFLKDGIKGATHALVQSQRESDVRREIELAGTEA